MKIIRNSILGLATLYLVGNAIGCAPVQQRDSHAELDALLLEPVPEMVYLRSSEPKLKEAPSRVESPFVFADSGYSARKEAEAYLAPKASVVPVATAVPTVEVVVDEEMPEDVYRACREGLETSLPQGIHISCTGGESDCYASCVVDIGGREYKVKTRNDRIQEEGAKAAYFTLLGKKPRLVDQLAKDICSMRDYAFSTEEVEEAVR